MTNAFKINNLNSELLTLSRSFIATQNHLC
jgi:hypothetical protein